MRLKLPISVLTIVAAAFAWIGATRAAGDCALGPQEDFQFLRFASWLTGRTTKFEGQCDVWAGERSTRPVMAVWMLQRLPRPEINTGMLLSGQGDIWLGPHPDDKLPIPDQRMTAAKRAQNREAFAAVMALPSPLRDRALPDDDYDGTNAMMFGLGGRGGHGRIQIHKCLVHAPHKKWPVYLVMFKPSAGESAETFTISGDCADKATKSAVERINRARQVMASAAGLDPGIDMLSPH